MSLDEQIGKIEGKLDMMISNQDKMMNWFEKHAESDNTKFTEINKSVSGLKGKLSLLTLGLVAVAEGGKHAVMSFFGLK
jgi:hypothetical protein